jgi:precorrin-6A/cobalt-precorrin-6A reductase
MRVLILGGTGEARALADRLVAMGHEVTTSLAGRTSDPILPEGNIRVGKFGGAPGLVGYLRAARIEWLVDATHPYADLISVNAVAAARASGVPLLRLTRPKWIEPEGAGWIHVPDMAGAPGALPAGASVLVTTGHEGLETLLARRDCHFVVRLIEAPASPLPAYAVLVRERPPYTIEGERALMAREGITLLVTKNSGGEQTVAKLRAAEQLGVAVVMVDRPVQPAAQEVGSVDEAVEAIPYSAVAPTPNPSPQGGGGPD